MWVTMNQLLWLLRVLLSKCICHLACHSTCHLGLSYCRWDMEKLLPRATDQATTGQATTGHCSFSRTVYPMVSLVTWFLDLISGQVCWPLLTSHDNCWLPLTCSGLSLINVMCPLQNPDSWFIIRFINLSYYQLLSVILIIIIMARRQW